MKKYIFILLLILLPTVALADCETDVTSAIQTLSQKFGYTKEQGCSVVTDLSQPGNPCSIGFNSFETYAKEAMKTYNRCTSASRAEELYGAIKADIAEYNTYPTNRNFNLNGGGNACAKDIQNVLKSLNTNKSGVTQQGCRGASGGGNCAQALNSYEKAISAAEFQLTSHAKSECDIKQFKSEIDAYIADFNQYGVTYESSANKCIDEASKVMNKIAAAKADIEANKCNVGVDITSECQDYIHVYKETLDIATKKKDEVKECSSYIKYEESLTVHVNYYNTLPYVYQNGHQYNQVDRQQKEVVRDPVFCPLGDDVTKDLVGVLRIMKIAAPILVFAYTLYETIKALTNGSMADESRKLFQRFAKRCGAAVLLFAIPVLIDTLMQMFNVWDSTGRCVLEDPQPETEFVIRK